MHETDSLSRLASTHFLPLTHVHVQLCWELLQSNATIFGFWSGKHPLHMASSWELESVLCHISLQDVRVCRLSQVKL